MANMRLDKNPMPEQDPNIRNKNFDEVALGYTEEQAIDEAQRCLNCKNPLCRQGCPVSVRIPEFISKVAEGDFDAAYEIITSTNSLPAVCGRVCPQEKQCEGQCIRGKKGESVGIGRLERFVADYHMNKENLPDPEVPASNGHKVAVVGSGPSSLTCSGDLRKMGYDVTVYESFHKPGGVLVYGIPQFRLPKEIVAKEIENLQKLGVNIVTDAVIGKAMTIDELFDDFGYEAVYVGSGAGLPRFQGIPGENLLGVYSANEFLTRVNLMKAYKDNYDTPIKHPKKVCVVGGGNVAMDASRVAKRLGADVTIVYRRGMDELPARKEEVEHAIPEGINFQVLSNPIKVIGDENDYVVGLECQKMELGEPDEKGRRRPIPVEGANFNIECDCVVIAIGTSPNPLILSTTENLVATKKGGIEADENGQTSREGVFAGGDAVTGAATVILAMGAGKTGAASIDKYIKSKNA